MKEIEIVAISDTHNQHNDLLLNEWLEDIEDKENCILIHAGDVSGRGTVGEVNSFMYWYHNLPFKNKVFIAGNHDFLFENEPHLIQEMLKDYPSIVYLNDSGVTINGFKIWGSPINPWFHDWAFNRERGDDIMKHWSLIPNDTDILVTHSPPYLHGDQVRRGGERVGCEDLLKIIEKYKIPLHISGHIHEDNSITTNENTTFINASVLDENYNLINKPYKFIFK